MIVPHVHVLAAAGAFLPDARFVKVMPGAGQLALRCKHIADRYEHLVRYLDQVAEGFPDLRIIAGHACYPYVREAIGRYFFKQRVFQHGFVISSWLNLT